jgi:hypothetical protein
MARALACALATTAAHSVTAASCLVLASHPDGKALAQVEAARGSFTISYVHSVTRTPVVEHYRVDGATIVETELRFEQHGPGLPTEADAGGTWREEGGRFVVTMNRRFPAIAMRVHADQSPRLAVDGDRRAVNLAQWGNRALALSARAGACLTGPPPDGRGAR